MECRWRAPGSASVFGSGCGVAGGSKDVYLNGGSIKGYPQGMDGLELPKVGKPEVWTRGKTAEIAWAIAANHGGKHSMNITVGPISPYCLRNSGGYSYRICPADGVVNEECFQVWCATMSCISHLVCDHHLGPPTRLCGHHL